MDKNDIYKILKKYGSLDLIVKSVAFALKGRIVPLELANFTVLVVQLSQASMMAG